MSRLHSLRRWSRHVVVPAVFALSVIACGTPTVSAADSLKESTSLGFVPADAAYYSSSQRTQEQYEAFINSNAFARLKSLPSVQQLTAMIDQQWNNPFSPVAQAKLILSQPENQQLLELLGDIFSHETFVYGDDRTADLARLFVELNTANRIATLEGRLQGGNADPTASIRNVLKTLEARRATLVTPNIVYGFKITNVRTARTQLRRLETLLKFLDTDPQGNKHLKREKIGETVYFTVNLDGSMLPWDDILPLIQGFEEEQGDYDKLIDHVKKMKLAFAFGVRNEYLILGIGESADHLVSLESKKLLIDRPEFAKLNKFADKPLTGISYVSKAFAEKSNQQQQQLESLLGMANSLVPQLPIEDDLKKEILKDVQGLDKKLYESDATIGAKLSLAFRSERGFESYSYNWSSQEILDGSKKLTLFEHLGSTPLAFGIGRTQYNPESYGTAVEFVKKLFHYGETAALVKATDEERTRYAKLRKDLLPLFARLDKATSEAMIPAFKDGQVGIVLDADIVSKQWHRDMPESSKPLPMFELGIIYGVSDAKLVRRGFSEYFDVTQAFLEKLHTNFPDDIPEITLPKPETASDNGVSLFKYPVPADLGLDKQIVPTAGLSDQVAVFSTSASQARRLLGRSKFTPSAGPLSALDRPLAGAGYFNFAGFIDKLGPWVEYIAIGVASSQAISTEETVVQDAEQAPELKAILDQVHTGLEILKCFRGASSVTYLEKGITVTHSETVVKDLPPLKDDDK
jgi:hypothetical protein